MNDWLEVFYDECGYSKTKMVEVSPPPMLPPSVPVPVPNSTLAGISEKTPGGIKNLNELVALDGLDSFMQPASTAPVNSLIDPPSSSESDSDSVVEATEPMDCAITPGSTPVHSDIDSPAPHSEVCVEIKDVCNTPADSMQVDTEVPVSTCEVSSSNVTMVEKFNIDDLGMLVDLFYLPFEHGSQASELLTQFHWLKCNAHAVTNGKSNASSEQLNAAAEWQSRALLFKEKIFTVLAMIDRLFRVPNKALLQDLFPYVWDVKGLMTLVDTFVSWLGMRLCYDW